MNSHEAKLLLFKDKEVFDGYIDEVVQEERQKSDARLKAFAKSLKWELPVRETLPGGLDNIIDRLLAETLKEGETNE